MTAPTDAPFTDEQIAEALKLCDAATPGPWHPSVWIETDGNEWRATGPGHEENAHDYGSEPGCPDEQAAQRDAAFIAAARTLLPAALRELKAAREQIATDTSSDAFDTLSFERDVAVQACDAAQAERDAIRAEVARLRALLGEACDIGDRAINEVTHPTSRRELARIRAEATSKEGR